VVDFLLAIIVGFFAGVLVNALADVLPYRRSLAKPVYPDGTPRPVAAWSGIGAFVMGLRCPKVEQPDENQQRLYEGKPCLSWRYPLAEIGTIILMILCVFAIHAFPLARAALSEPIPTDDKLALQLAFWWIYCAIYMLITVIDIEYKLILRIVVFPTVILAIINVLISPETSTIPQDAVYGALMGFAPFMILYLGGFLFTYILGQMRGQEIDTVAFGFGDVMLMTLSGILLGFSHTIFALFIAVFLGAFGAFLYIVGRALFGSRYNWFTAIPYGPYIVFATILMLLYGDEVRRFMIGY
jgi:prepilin signal peptidase PulO-like enzyme (type II secretory pathway)